MRLGYIRIVVIYFFVSIGWIISSDKLLFLLNHEVSSTTLLWLSSSKGFVFITISSLLLLKLIKTNGQKLLHNEKQYRSIYQDNVLAMLIYDPKTYHIIDANRAALEKYGYSDSEFREKTIFDINPSAGNNEAADHAEAISSHFRPSDVHQHYKKDGQPIDVRITTQQILFNSRQLILVIAEDITENIALEKQLDRLNEELKEQKRKLSETQQMAKVAGWEVDLDNRKLIWSDELYKLTDAAPDLNADPFKSYLAYIHPEDRPKMIRALNDLMNTGNVLDVVHRIVKANNEVKYVHQIARVEYCGDKPCKIVGAMQDITELKEMEQERNKYVYTLEDTLDSMSESFYALNRDFVVTKVNRKFEIETGIRHEQCIGRKVTDVFPGIQHRMTYKHLKRALEERVTVKFEAYSHSLRRWLDTSAFPTQEGVAVYFTNISEGKEKDLQLKEAMERYEFVAKATHDIIYEYDLLKGSVTYHTSLSELFGISRDEVDEDISWWRSKIHPEDLGKIQDTQQRVIEGKETNWNLEYRIDVGHQLYKYVFDQGYFVYDHDRNPLKLIGAVKDIDALKKANEENRKLADIITKVNNMVVVMNAENRITWVNKAFEDYCGHPIEQLLGHYPIDFLSGPETSAETMAYILEAKKEQKTFSVELVHYVGQRERWVNIEYTPLFNDCGKFTGYIAVHQDITLRKQKEEQINRQNTALQQIAWLSSHEIRRPVASIMGLVNLVDETTPEKEKDEMIALLKQSAQQLDKIIYNITDKIQTEVGFNEKLTV